MIIKRQAEDATILNIVFLVHSKNLDGTKEKKIQQLKALCLKIISKFSKPESTCSGCSLGVSVMATSSLVQASTFFSGLGSALGLRLKKLRKLKGPVCCLGLFMMWD